MLLISTLSALIIDILYVWIENWISRSLILTNFVDIANSAKLKYPPNISILQYCKVPHCQLNGIRKKNRFLTDNSVYHFCDNLAKNNFKEMIAFIWRMGQWALVIFSKQHSCIDHYVHMIVRLPRDNERPRVVIAPDLIYQHLYKKQQQYIQKCRL